METVAKHRGVRHHTPGIAGLCLLIAASLLIVACGSSSNKSSGAAATAGSASWSLPGGDLQNTRHVGGPINASNVSTLGVAWTVPLTATGTFGAYAATPVVVNGVMYTQDLASNVQAIDFKTGAVLCIHKYNSPDVGPNGVNVVNGVVYGATESSAFALQAASGKQLWNKKPTRNGNEGLDMPPAPNAGTAYSSTPP